MSNLPDLHVDRLTEFMRFAETPPKDKHHNQRMWGWAEAPRDFTVADARDLATQVRNGVCQSAFCAAGHGAYEAGNRLVYTAEAMINGRNNETFGITADMCIQERPKMHKGEPVLDDKGRQVWEDVPHAAFYPISTVGAEWYGLSGNEATAFFAYSNSLDQMKSLVNTFCERRDLPLPYPDHDVLHLAEYVIDTVGEEYDLDEDEILTDA